MRTTATRTSTAAASRLTFFVLLTLLLCFLPCRSSLWTKQERQQLQPSQTCSLDGVDAPDPNLHEMVYDVGDGPKTTMVYVEPDVNTFYRKGGGDKPAAAMDEEENRRTKVVPKFKGLTGKFINMSNKPVSFYWCVPIRLHGMDRYARNGISLRGMTQRESFLVRLLVISFSAGRTTREGRSTS